MPDYFGRHEHGSMHMGNIIMTMSPPSQQNKTTSTCFLFYGYIWEGTKTKTRIFQLVGYSFGLCWFWSLSLPRNTMGRHPNCMQWYKRVFMVPLMFMLSHVVHVAHFSHGFHLRRQHGPREHTNVVGGTLCCGGFAASGKVHIMFKNVYECSPNTWTEILVRPCGPQQYIKIQKYKIRKNSIPK